MGARRCNQNRVAIRCRPCHGLRTNHTRSTCTVFNHNGLTQFGTELLSDNARHEVCCATRRKRHNHFDGLIRVGLSKGGGCGQTGKGGQACNECDASGFHEKNSKQML